MLHYIQGREEYHHRMLHHAVKHEEERQGHKEAWRACEGEITASMEQNASTREILQPPIEQENARRSKGTLYLADTEFFAKSSSQF